MRRQLSAFAQHCAQRTSKCGPRALDRDEVRYVENWGLCSSGRRWPQAAELCGERRRLFLLAPPSHPTIDVTKE